MLCVIYGSIGPDDPHTIRVQKLFKQHLQEELEDKENDGMSIFSMKICKLWRMYHVYLLATSIKV